MWVLYNQGDMEHAEFRSAAIRVFDEISQPDARLTHLLREAFEYVRDDDREAGSGGSLELRFETT